MKVDGRRENRIMKGLELIFGKGGSENEALKESNRLDRAFALLKN